MQRFYVLGFILAVIATTVMYCLGLGNFFLFDDAPAISANLAVAKLPATTAAGWRDLLFSSGAGPTGRPLAMATFGLNALGVDGLSATHFKFTNVLIHLACGLLLLGFLWQLQGLEAEGAKRLTRTAAVVAVAIWLLAPLHVSTVLYPVQRMAQLATLFVLLGLYLYTRWRRQWMLAGAGFAEVIAAALWLALVSLAALLSKENGVLLLWLLPLVEVVFFRGRFAGQERPWVRRFALLALVSPLLLTAWVALAAPDLLLSGYQGREFTMGERLLTQLRVLWLYVGWFLLPLPQWLGFLHDDLLLSTGWVSPWTTALAGLGWLVAIAAAVYGARSQPWLLFGLWFYLIGHSVESGFLALELIFEHRNYLPSVGLSVIVAMGLCTLASRHSAVAPRFVWLGYFVPLLLLLGMRTYTWGDDLRMAQTNAQHHPASPRGQYLLATAYERQHRIALASPGTPDITSLLESRAALQRMDLLAPDSLVAPLALYLFDSRWFPGNPEQTAALSKVLEGIRKPVLSASESNGINALVGGAVATCGSDAHAVTALVDALPEAQPDALDWHLARYRLAHCAIPSVDTQQMLRELEATFPTSVAVLYLRLEASVEENDVAAMYNTLATMQALDDGRKLTSQLRRLVSD
jgi:protein O-mannosyl-transferase